MMNGGGWQNSTVGLARIRVTRVERRTRRYWPGVAQDSMPYSVVDVPRMASMPDWTPTDSTGPGERVTRLVAGSTTLLVGGKRFIVKMAAKRRERFQFGASESDGHSGPVRICPSDWSKSGRELLK